MTLVAALATVALTVTVLAFLAIVRSLIRQQVRERELLQNKLLHAVGKPWQQAPASVADHEAYVARLDDELAARRAWTSSPEQRPVN